MKRVLAVLAVLLVTLTSAKVAKRSAGIATAAPSADLLNETFDNATNYDDGTGANAWTEVIDAGVNDPNETATCPVGTGFGSECLQTIAGAANRKAYIVNELAALQDGPVYFVFYVDLVTMTAWPGDDSHPLCGGTTTAVAVPGVSDPFVCSLEWDSDGITSGESACASGANLPACWRLRMRVAGGTSRAPEITTGAIHKVKFKVDNGVATGEAWLDSTQYISGEQTSADVRYIWLGILEFSKAAEDIVYDGVTVSTTGYLE